MDSNLAAEHLQVIRTLMERSAVYRRALAPVMIFAGALGMVAGFVGGWIERLITWLMDVILSFPALVLLIALVAYVGHSLLDISSPSAS